MIVLMKFIPGNLYAIKPGTGRSLWPSRSLETERDLLGLGRVNSGDVVLFLEEARIDEKSSWVKIVAGEMIGYMVHGFSSLDHLLEPVEDEP